MGLPSALCHPLYFLRSVPLLECINNRAGLLILHFMPHFIQHIIDLVRYLHPLIKTLPAQQLLSLLIKLHQCTLPIMLPPEYLFQPILPLPNHRPILNEGGCECKPLPDLLVVVLLAYRLLVD